MPGGEGADAAGSVIATESGPCVALICEGAWWVTFLCRRSGGFCRACAARIGYGKTP